MRLIAFLAVAMVAVSAATSWAAGAPDRQVAITVDDLPAGAADRMSGAGALMQKLVSSYLSYSDAVFDVLRAALQQDRRLRSEADSAAARQSTGSGSHRRPSRRAAQARVPVHHARGRSQRPSLWHAGHVCRGRRHRMAGPLGDYPGQAAAGLPGISAMGD